MPTTIPETSRPTTAHINKTKASTLFRATHQIQFFISQATASDSARVQQALAVSDKVYHELSVASDLPPLYRIKDARLSINNCPTSCNLASIPGRVFAFITVRRTTRPGTSCLRMRQSFVRF